MSTKDKDQCIKNAFEDEMLFVLMARDITAPQVIRHWVGLNKGKHPQAKLEEALACALKMEKQHQEITLRKSGIQLCPECLGKNPIMARCERCAKDGWINIEEWDESKQYAIGEHCWFGTELYRADLATKRHPRFLTEWRLVKQ